MVIALSCWTVVPALANDDSIIIRNNERTLEQIQGAYAQIPPVQYSPPVERWEKLPKTSKLLTEGGTLRVVMLGDSIVNDTSRSCWNFLVERRQPKCRIEKITCVRGSTGCWWYKEPGRVQKYVLDHKPDLVIIGGISHRDDVESIRDVIRQIQAAAQPDILLMTGAFGSTDPLKDEPWQRISDPSRYGEYRKGLEKLAGEVGAAFLDMEAAWANYVRESGRQLDSFKRDPIHANAQGEQILGHILANYLSYPSVRVSKERVAGVPPSNRGQDARDTTPDGVTTNQETDPLVWDKLDKFQDWKLGFMMHWGIYSQWGCIESWPLVEADPWARPDDLPAWTARGKDFGRFFADYVALNKTFNPQKFDPTKWVAAVKDAGMKYVVFTTKHHDGFCLFDTKQTDYRTTDASCPFHTNPKADVVKEVFNTFRAEGFGIGAYYSKSDWHHPGYWSPDGPHQDRNVNYDTSKYPEKWATFVDFTYNIVQELMTNYGPVDILWLDGGQVRPPQQDINMPKLAAMARTHQSGLLVVDRTVGGRYENYRTPEQEVPEKAMPYVWETCMTMATQWSYKPDDKYKSTRQLIHLLVNIVAKGGNFLVNVGPSPDGELPEPALQRMKEIGQWMRTNGEAIYGTRPIPPYKAGQVCLTKKGEKLYAICLAEEGQTTLPERIHVPPIKAAKSVKLLGSRVALEWTVTPEGLSVSVPQDVRKSPPCEHAWAFEIEGGRLE
jgi:alpha-L-fucosidase